MKNPLKKVAMGMGNVGDEETQRLMRMIQVRSDNKALLGKLFEGADEASREKARASAESLFIQTPAVQTMRPNMQTKEAADAKPESKGAKKSTPSKPHPLKTLEKVHKTSVDAVKHVAVPGSEKKEEKPKAAEKTASVEGMEKRALAKNIYECFEKRAYLSDAQRRYPELLKAAASAASVGAGRPFPTTKKPASVSDPSGPTPKQSSLAGGSA